MSHRHIAWIVQATRRRNGAPRCARLTTSSGSIQTVFRIRGPQPLRGRPSSQLGVGSRRFARSHLTTLVGYSFPTPDSTAIAAETVQRPGSARRGRYCDSLRGVNRAAVAQAFSGQRSESARRRRRRTTSGQASYPKGPRQMTDHTTGATKSQRGTGGTAARRIAVVKRAVGQGTANAGARGY
jgi:hypothetical protein